MANRIRQLRKEICLTAQEDQADNAGRFIRTVKKYIYWTPPFFALYMLKCRRGISGENEKSEKSMAGNTCHSGNIPL